MTFKEEKTIEEWKEQAHKQGKILVILCGGFSASGKDTRCRSFGLKKVITTTTRPIREKEVDGVDYHFVTVEKFGKMLENDQLLEATKYSQNWYGTTKDEFLKCFENKTDCVAILDIAGIMNVFDELKKEFADKMMVKKIYYFINKETFEKRICSRDKNIVSKEYLKTRWNQNIIEWEKLLKLKNEFDLVEEVNENVILK